MLEEKNKKLNECFYYVPDFYATFHCKCGECRKTCCEGWNVSLSLKEYFQILSLDCSQELKNRIDASVQIALHPTPERYALFTPTFYGDCPLRDESNGYCYLQEECGESALPAICKYYPRSFCHYLEHEATLSNSCEGVLELLCDSPTKITFHKKLLSLPSQNLIPLSFSHQLFYHVEKEYCYEIIENRQYSLFERLTLLGNFLAIQENHSFSYARFQMDTSDFDLTPKKVTSDEFEFQKNLMKEITKKSPSIHGILQELEKNFQVFSTEDSINEDNSLNLFQNTVSAWKEENKSLEVFLEKVLVNHMIYTGFPFDYENDLSTKSWLYSYYGLVETYVFIVYILSLLNEGMKNKTSLIDTLGEIFRYIEHSSFEKNVLAEAQEHNRASFQDALILLSLVEKKK